jgi:Xaa-Pro aminopeptidase
MNTVYAQRRAQLAAAMGPNDVAIIPTAPTQLRNRDADYAYRHDSYFYYLCGFTEPNAWLVIAANGHTTLLCQPKDLERETWDGYRLGPDAAPVALGVDAALSSDALDLHMADLMANKAAIWWPFATHEGLHHRLEGWLQSVRAKSRQGVSAPQSQHDACAVLDEMRLIKDHHEIATMRRAGYISAQAHVRAMQRSARMLRAGQDAREYHLDAELLHCFREHGAEGPAYTSIVAAGANACVLHYRAGHSAVRRGELVLIDAACELDSYASDITRTFPADCHFTAPQRDVYAVVLAAQEAAIAATRAGARFDDPHDAATRVLAQGMLDLKLLDTNTVGGLDDVLASRAYARFYMHRTGHWLGMDVHDCGAYQDPDPNAPCVTVANPAGAEPIIRRASRRLTPGMVLTIEPGLYIRAADDVPAAFHDIGVRIEDDAVVTEGGCELLTRDVPVAMDEIEALMRA